MMTTHARTKKRAPVTKPRRGMQIPVYVYTHHQYKKLPRAFHGGANYFL